MNTCETCEHYRVERRGVHDVFEYERRCDVEVFDPITGKMGEPDPILSRMHDRYCGIEGKFWKAK